jgi:hypothetical protein
MLFLFLLGIPYRFLKLVFYFISSKHKFADALEILFYSLKKELDGRKIEVLNKKIYLNCITKGKLFMRARGGNKNIDNEKIFNFFVDLKRTNANFYEYENRNREYIRAVLMSAFDGKTCIFGYHYGLLLNILNKTAIHGTSSIPKNLYTNQRVDIPMPSLIRHGALNPGTVITPNFSKITVRNRSL